MIRRTDPMILDYGARQYDPLLLTWNAIDPLAEKYYSISPYAYCANNPVNAIDPDGRDGNIIVCGNNITISANIYIYGSGATKSVQQQMQKDINNVWNKNYSVKHNRKIYNVKFDIKLSLYGGKEKNNPFVIFDRWHPFSRNNYISVSEDVSRSYVNNGREGEWRSTGRNGRPLSIDDPAPHEVGHLLGLSDQYVDEVGPNKGWEDNIMGNSKNGKVDNRNINDILREMWLEYNKWLEKGNTGVFKYEIDAN